MSIVRVGNEVKLLCKSEELAILRERINVGVTGKSGEKGKVTIRKDVRSLGKAILRVLKEVRLLG